MAPCRSRRSRASWLESEGRGRRRNAVQSEGAWRTAASPPPRRQLLEVSLEHCRLAHHPRAEHFGEWDARAASDQRLRQPSGFAEVPDVGMAVHGEGVERDDPVGDAVHRLLERRADARCCNASSNSPTNEQYRVFTRATLTASVGISNWIDRRLPDKRHSTGAAFERPPPQQLGGERDQHFGHAGEQLGPELVEVECASDGRVGEDVSHDAIAQQLKAVVESPAANRCRTARPA